MPISMSTVGNACAGTFRFVTHIVISLRDALSPSFSTAVLILKNLTSYAPTNELDVSVLRHLSDLKWANVDPTSSETI